MVTERVAPCIVRSPTASRVSRRCSMLRLVKRIDGYLLTSKKSALRKCSSRCDEPVLTLFAAIATDTADDVGSAGTYTIIPRTSSNRPCTGWPRNPIEKPTSECAASIRYSRNGAGDCARTRWTGRTTDVTTKVSAASRRGIPQAPWMIGDLSGEHELANDIISNDQRSYADPIGFPDPVRLHADARIDRDCPAVERAGWGGDALVANYAKSDWKADVAVPDGPTENREASPPVASERGAAEEHRRECVREVGCVARQEVPRDWASEPTVGLHPSR